MSRTERLKTEKRASTARRVKQESERHDRLLGEQTRIERRLRKQLADLDSGGVRAAVLDAPVMLKAGWDRMCDFLLFVDTPRQVRLARARQRGWTEADFAAREAAQEPVEAKRSRASTILDNSSSWAQLYAQVDRFWRSLSE